MIPLLIFEKHFLLSSKDTGEIISRSEFNGQTLTGRNEGRIGVKFSKFLTQIFSRFPFWFLRRLPGNLPFKTNPHFCISKTGFCPNGLKQSGDFINLGTPTFQSTGYILIIWFLERTLTAKHDSIFWAFHRLKIILVENSQMVKMNLQTKTMHSQSSDNKLFKNSNHPIMLEKVARWLAKVELSQISNNSFSLTSKNLENNQKVDL